MQSASDVCSSLTPRTTEIPVDTYGLIVREIPQLRGDKRILTLLEASVGENVATLPHIIQHGIDLENVHGPAASRSFPALTTLPATDQESNYQRAGREDVRSAPSAAPVW